MRSGFLIYGSTGFVGGAIARLAVRRGLRPIVAGRDAAKVEAQATELGLDHRVFSLDDPVAMDSALKDVAAVLHCAGPFVGTSRAMVDGCLRTGAHYLDITGEIPVYEELAARDAESKARGVMVLPGVGFDVAATDCLALHLKHRLPTATRLALAFHIEGPAGMPPGTAKSIIEMVPYGNRVRRDGRMQTPPRGGRTRLVDFGRGPIKARMLAWGDVFTAYHSTGIPNIQDFAALPSGIRREIALTEYLRPLFKLAAVRNFLKSRAKPGPTPEESAQTRATVWGEVMDDEGRTATSQLHGPDAGVVWTSRAALAAVERVLAGEAPPGFQTPSLAYGADFILECEGVTREDLA